MIADLDMPPTMEIPTSIPMPEAVVRRLRPPDRLTVSQWCDRHRELHPKYSAEPGRWHTSRVPYLREIMDAFADPSVGSIVFIKCARVGGTEFLNNCIAYSIDQRPMPMLYVLPKETDVNDEFTGRIKSLIESSPTLIDHVQPGTWNTTAALYFDSMQIYGAWATSPNTLIRRTCGVVIFDEIDNCEAAAGRLGNTWKVAGERVATFGYRAKLIGTTTPTVEDATGWQEYQASDRRRFHVPCPECGHYQPLVFSSLIWPGGKSADDIELETLATYACSDCGASIEQTRQRWMVDRGVWVPASQRINGRLPVQDADIVERASSSTEIDRWTPAIVGDPPRTRRRGYWINSLYSPWRTWSQIAAEFLRAKGDADRMRVFMNSWLAEPWKPSVEAPDESWLAPKVAAARHNAGTVPAEARILLATADVQQDVLYYVVRAWGPSMRSWLVEAGQSPTFEGLYDRLFATGFPVEGTSDRMRVYALACDARYRGDEVHAFALQPGVCAVFGYERRTKPVERSNIAPRGATEPRWVWNVNTTLYKDKLARLMRADLAGSGAWGLHIGTSADYMQHITSEHGLMENKNGRRHWVWRKKTSSRANHWWDCEVYQLCLIDILEQTGEAGLLGLTLSSPRVGLIASSPTPGHPKPPPSAPSQRRRTQIRTPWDRM